MTDLPRAYSYRRDMPPLLDAADQIVRSKFHVWRFIEGTPLENDIAVWMADFAQKVASGEDYWPEAIPEPFYWGLIPWIYRRLTGWRDEYGRKAKLMPWSG